MFFNLFLYGIIYWILKKIPLEILRGLKWHDYVGNGGLVECVRVHTMEEGGQIFVILMPTY